MAGSIGAPFAPISVSTSITSAHASIPDTSLKSDDRPARKFGGENWQEVSKKLVKVWQRDKVQRK
jgi:hypothetical protein